ncbi:hypothetical protein SZ64_13250 [Erythrobacter sp. SG61-1L]|uniref:hypothetical protein n=1 Tax=Erythrobacter sp. SG61-1L TaxID=1603897 RepID=UPI0006C929A6|nr:hypothetical protein [Erythrobacter sp. SG61-1L]KPL68982.1 hypothetical protein SZ64_13250 [Erythrobacter sp. SG61-1L]
MSRHGPWKVLGIDPTDDLKAIRRAYADKLRAMDVDQDAAAYERLRDARDHALYLAKSMSAPLEPLEEEEEDEWGLGFAMAEEDVQGPYSGAWGHHGDAGPFAAEPEPPQAAEPGPDMLLQHLLFPGGEQSDQGFTYEEYEAAQGLLRQIVATALEGDVSLQRSIDFWLADRLASAWPRSAPLVIEAAEAFEWERQAGMLGEGPAQAFLNARLRGMRFHEKVQAEGHWAHKAWAELSRPGEKKWYERSAARSADVSKLLAGVREHFPEIEAFLDADRVRSWERKSRSDAWGMMVPIMIGLFMLARVFASISQDTDSSPFDAPPVTMNQTVSAEDARNFIVHELFGPDTVFEVVAERSPTIAQLITQKVRGVDDEIDQEIAADELAITLREGLVSASRAAGFEELVQIDQLKLELATLAKEKSGSQACMAMLQEGRLFPSIVPPPELRERERALAVKLLESRKLESGFQSQPGMSASVPGAVIDAAQRASGLSDKEVQDALKHKGSYDVQCTFHLALMGEVLRQPAKVPGDLLRVL